MPYLLPRSIVLRDFAAGLVVFFVALPLCLGVAHASGAPLFAGLVAGAIGGLVIGVLSGSHTSVSGPSPGATAVILAQIAALGSFNTFLIAVVVAGLIQIAMGFARAGFLAAFFPSSVVKGLLAAIGVILILKQIPHVLGHDTDPEGDMSFQQPDHETTFSEFGELPFDLHLGAATIGLVSLAVLCVWGRSRLLARLPLPAPLAVVGLGVLLEELFRQLGGPWVIQASHLVQVPLASTAQGVLDLFPRPDLAQFANPAVYFAGLSIALVASLETLLNIEAVDRIDPRKRVTPASRELAAQGVGNVMSGLLGGLPISSVIVRSSVNINAGAQTKLSTIAHGALLALSVVFLAGLLNRIPLACLAAILLVTGVKLINPAIVRHVWSQGRYQFIPFLTTLVAIVLTDLTIGVLIGLAVSLAFILNSNRRQPVRRFVEKHLSGDVLHIELANQVSFLNRAALVSLLDGVPRGGHVLLNAETTAYIDPDVLDLIREFKHVTAPARGITVSLRGFKHKYQLDDELHYVESSNAELQEKLTPAQVLSILVDGNRRFRQGQRLTRDISREVRATAQGQHPLAVVLSCIDSRAPAELVFDLGLGDIFSVRVAGNIVTPEVLGSIEYACAVAGAKLVLVMGHSRCGAVTTAVHLAGCGQAPPSAQGCRHIDPIVAQLQNSIDGERCALIDRMPAEERDRFVDDVARQNVRRAIQEIERESPILAALKAEGRLEIAGAMYDVVSGEVSLVGDDNGENETPRWGDDRQVELSARG